MIEVVPLDELPPRVVTPFPVREFAMELAMIVGVFAGFSAVMLLVLVAAGASI
jgi:hypothetical protein